MRERLAAAAQAAVGSRWWYPALGALLTGTALIDAALLRRAPSTPSTLLSVAVCAAVGFCGRFPFGASLDIGVLYAGVGLPGLTDAAPDVSIIAPAIAAYAVAAHAGRRVATVALILITGSLEIAGIRSGTWAPGLFVASAPWLVGAIVRSRQQMVAQLEQRTTELDCEREAFAGLAAQRERARIARELHDIVSHNMAVMIVQAGAGRIAPPDDPELVADIFRRIRAAGGAALAEMDQLVDVLGLHVGGPTGASPLACVIDLVDQARAAGLDITAELSVTDSALPVEVQQAAYRAIQEGLTNALKHAPESHVQLRVQAPGRQLEIEVRNTGTPGASGPLAASGSGLGLAGISERIHANGGEFSAGPLPDGGWHFAVRLLAPSLAETAGSRTSQG